MRIRLSIPGFHELIGLNSLPAGYAYEVYGEEHSGKTSMALHFMKAIQEDPNAVTVFIDGEHSFSPAHVRQYGIDPQRIHFSQPETLDTALKLLRATVQQHIPQLVIIDGLNALPTELEMAESLGGYTAKVRNASARLITQTFQSLVAPVWDQQIVVLALNQIRHRPNPDGTATEFVPGGRLLPVLCPLRIRLGNASIDYEDGAPAHFSADLEVTRNRFQPERLGTIRAIFPFVS